ncbi:carbonic anhydrase [Streptomyces sp. NPDC048385]|uniref:carbonic anhydrase n=1 Tax=unclassified Streptomyces TaxID=2593676 RepID=UPI00343DE9FF
MVRNPTALPTATAVGAPAVALSSTAVVPASASAALDELLQGNRRYATGRSRRRRSAAPRPLAAVLGCVDSPAAPELVFDQGVGDLLSMRTAGQVLDEAVLGSLQYGVQELRVPLVVVLGHDGCAAVAATLARLRTGAPVPGHLELLADQIAPAALRTRSLPGDWAEHTMRAQTVWARDAIRVDCGFAGASVMAARFDSGSGLVSLLP